MRFSKILLAGLFWFSFLQADGIGRARQVNAPPVNSDSSVFASYDSQQDRFLLSWWGDDMGVEHIYAAIYNADGSIAVPTIDLFASAYRPLTDINSCYNPHLNQYLLTWGDFYAPGGPGPVFCILGADGSVLRGVTAITNFQTSGSVMSCFNSNANQYFVTWSSGSYPLYFAILNEDGTVFKGATLIPPAMGGDANSGNLFCCYNSQTDQYLVSWAGEDFGVYIAMYDASGSAVKPATLTAPFSGYTPVANCYNGRNNQYFLSWNDSSNNGNFAILDEAGDILYGPAAILGFVNNRGYPVCSAYNSAGNTYLVVSVTTDNKNQFAILSDQGAVETAPAFIPNPSGFTTQRAVYACFGSALQNTWITWGAENGGLLNGYFAIYSTLQSAQSAPASTCFKIVQPNRPVRTCF